VKQVTYHPSNPEKALLGRMYEAVRENHVQAYEHHAVCLRRVLEEKHARPTGLSFDPSITTARAVTTQKIIAPHHRLTGRVYNDSGLPEIETMAGVKIKLTISPYQRMGSSKVKHQIHRFVAQYAYGDIPEGWEVHHIDGDASNYHPRNLECIPPALNKALAKKATRALPAGFSVGRGFRRITVVKLNRWSIKKVPRPVAGVDYYDTLCQAAIDMRRANLVKCGAVGKLAHYADTPLVLPPQSKRVRALYNALYAPERESLQQDLPIRLEVYVELVTLAETLIKTHHLTCT
jgi:HNH endonuclease